LSSVLFLGSGGARFVVARQLRASGGTWWRFGGTQIHVDPGPGALVRALSHVPPCNPRELAALILSHKHLDHSGDATAMVEAMTSGGFKRRGMLVAPADALRREPVVFPYAQRFVAEIRTIGPCDGPFRIGDVEVTTSPRHLHGVETYGLHFAYAGRTYSYMPCGRYDEAIVEDYARRRPDLLLVNVLRYREGMKADHLTWEQACRVIARVRPKVAVFQHFGTNMLEHDPRRLAQELEDELGLRAIAAYDDLELDLDVEVEAAGG
jgi:phosphoribosyl 1,2-cyclic phosphodiesterase